MNSKVKTEFETAYLQTNYVVQDGENQIVIRIGKDNSVLQELLRRYGAYNCAFITAYNPFSKKLAVQENQSRQSELLNYLRQKHFRFLEGYGESQSNDWEPEPSAFIFDIGLNDAIAIGKRFEQNAFVFGKAESTPQLVWCR
ncbi:MAG TPA: DUF3293 domain-containing protein [Pyrinomonadaceae bacterium]|nr:DUF3293 domain-containing protein [Pyrinomonadaceae bacterium]